MNFFIHFLKDLKKTGAVAPSSKCLSRNLVKNLETVLTEKDCKGLNILEVGPGTGSLTKEIVKHIRPKDRFDVVEIQKGFYKHIQKKFADENIAVHYKDILNFSPSLKYDYIFSSLPYENMNTDLCNRIWDKKLSLCSSNGYISYFKYLSFRKFKNDFEEEVVKKFICDKKVVLRNLPPAKLYTLQVDSTSAPLAQAV